jgi:ornithine cyclodeaminase/alanine dehydrogenase-like protein (mu-crystallin family)
MPFSPRLLDDTALRALAIWPEAVVAALRVAVRDIAANRLSVTPKSVLQPGDGRYMMATLATGDVTVVKAVTVCPDNPDRGLPTITGSIMVMDAQTGECLAVMDAEWITAVRTAGLSALAALEMADPHSKTIGFVGCGVQARSHLEMFAALFPLRRVLCFGRGADNIARLCAMAQDMGLQAEACETPEDLLQQADIVVSSITITYTGAPFLDAGLLKHGAFASVTDAAKPWHRDSLHAFGTVVVDDREQELSMPDPVVSADRMAGDLTDLVSGHVSIEGGPRAFMFRGIAAGDYALAAKVWDVVSARDA